MNRLRAATLIISLTLMSALIQSGGQFSLVAQDLNDPLSALRPETLRTWLTYLASDELEGRATFSEGLGMAAAYIAERLREAEVRPGGDNGTYFQRVHVFGVQSTNRSTLTVEVNGQTRTFSDGAGVNFPRNVGVPRTFTIDGVEFVGYGLNLGATHNDYAGRDVKNRVVLWLGQSGPAAADQQLAARMVAARASTAIEERGAAATLAPATGGGRGGGAPGRGGNAADFTTTQRLDLPRAPSLTVSDEFLEFLFGAAGLNYAEIKAMADKRLELSPATLGGVKLTFNLDATYRVVSTRYTRNVVGIVEGTDPQLRDTYVAFGSHYDHDGYTQGTLPPGQTDRIFNGADDDASGSTALIGIARSFAGGPKTRRSLIFVWHAGEELGLYGSRYFTDYPPIPLESIVAQLNMDMIGRNRNNDPSEENTVLAVGADRISTELHNLLIDANESLDPPMKIDFEMNDATDAERIYYRSDHYSYAAKGIPVVFFFTGLHPDYHRVTDTADKILYDKMSRIARLIYETGKRVANSEKPPARDELGPRSGRGFSGKLE
jgi:hypothetical protein